MKARHELRGRGVPQLLTSLERPAGERAGRLAHVVLGVVADARGKEFHQLPGVVLVGLSFAVGLGVEIDHHRGVLRDRLQELVEIPQRHAAEELVLGEELR